jgi:hypothetical protein
MKKRIILGLIFVLLLLIIAVSILPKPQDPFNWKMVVSVDENNTSTIMNVTYDSKTGESFGIGLYETPIHSPEYSIQLTKTVHENTSFEGYYWISNQMYDPNDYLIFCLLDYEQVPFSLDGSPLQVLHRVNLAPLEERFFHVEIGPLQEGGHDCEIFALLKTEEHSLDHEFRLSTDFSYLGSKRVNLLVNSTKMLDVRYSSLRSIGARECGTEYVINDGILLTRSPCQAEGWFSEDVRAGDDLAYWINVAADSRYPVSVAIVTLIDYLQVPVVEGTPETVLFLDLDTGEKVSVPARIAVPGGEGVHELMVLYLPAPYARLWSDSGEPIRTHQWSWTEPSIRVGLNVTALR